MKKQNLKKGLDLKKHMISSFAVDTVKGKGIETETCDCETRRKNCVTYEPTQDGCRTMWCTGGGCQ